MVREKDIINELVNNFKMIFAYIKIEYKFIAENDIDENSFDFSNDNSESIINYDESINKFIISINNVIKKYNNIDYIIEDKYYNNPYFYYSSNDISSLLSIKGISFIDYLKSIFLHEYFKKIINIISERNINYKDSYIECEKKFGSYFNDILIEIETRIFAKKYQLDYIPKDIGNDRILLLAKSLLEKKETRELIFNNNILYLKEAIPNEEWRIISSYEQKCFEEEFKLKRNAIYTDFYSNLLYKSSKNIKSELSDMLKEIKRQILNNPTNSSGYINTSVVIIVLLIFSILIILFFILVLGGYK